MHEKLWAGVELKLEYAKFHLEKMAGSLQPPERTTHNVARQAAGAIIDTGWQRAFYAHSDAFLAAARSVPWIIEACFGHDRNRQMKNWFDGLPIPEQDRRQQFSSQFKAARGKFDQLPLTNARNMSYHRAGFAPVEVTISGRFGVTHTGGPAERVPIAETRQTNDEHSWMDTPVPIQPMPKDFTINGKPLFDECKTYLGAARQLIHDACSISTTEHGAASLTRPPG